MRKPPAIPGRLGQTGRSCLRLGRALATGRSVPLSATYHVTFRCNLRCAYCRVPRASAELSTGQSLGLMALLARMGLLRVSFSGGEPLLREDLGALVRAARSRGVVVSLTTNGHLLTDRLDLVREVDTLFISLDGPARVHDAMCGAGAHQRTMAGVEAALGQGLDVTLVAVMTGSSMDGAEELLANAKALGVRVAFQPVVPWGGEGDPPPLEPAQHRALFRWLASMKRAGAPVANSTAHIQGALRSAEDPLPGPCLAGRLSAIILPDGGVAPCCEHHEGYRPRATPFTLARVAAELEALSPPRCVRCTTLGNLEMKRLLKFTPAPLLHAWSRGRAGPTPR